MAMLDSSISVVKAEVLVVGVTDNDPVGSLFITGMIRATVRPIPESPTLVGRANCHCESSL